MAHAIAKPTAKTWATMFAKKLHKYATPKYLKSSSTATMVHTAERRRSAARGQGTIHTDRLYRKSAASLRSARMADLFAVSLTAMAF
jgi:hypothetical protein